MSSTMPVRLSHVMSCFAPVVLVISLAVMGCSGGSGGNGPANGTGTPVGKREFLTLGTAPIGGAFQPVGNAIASVLQSNKGDNNWRAQAKSTKGSKQNIRMLDEGKLQLAMSNSAISYYAARREGSEWEKKYDIRAVVTLAPNVGLFITKKGSGIKSIADLKGKRVTVGPAGAGFEMFLEPLLSEHGVTYADFIQLNVPYTPSVQLLGDGGCDAAFMGGAIPTPAVTQACTSHDIAFIPYDPATRETLVEKYPFFQPATIPAANREGNATYRGMTEDFSAMNVGSMQLITSASMSEETIYQITKTIWEHRDEIAKQHGAGRAINEKNAARFTGTEFHPGAIKFYKEIGIFAEESGGDEKLTDEKPTDEKPTDEKPADEKPADGGAN